MNQRRIKMGVFAALTLSASVGIAAPPRDAVALDAAEMPVNYRLHIEFSAATAGAVRLGKDLVVPHELVDGKWQGAVCELPMPAFATGIMRGRFAADGALYTCGMYAWAGNATTPGGFYRVRKSDKPADVSLAIHAATCRMSVTFRDPLDPASVKPEAFGFKVWHLKRTEDYGSNHYDEHPLAITAARVSADARSVTLDIPTLRPTQRYELTTQLLAPDDTAIKRSLHGTNQVQMWHDFRQEVIEMELTAAERFSGINTLRIHLHNMVYDAEKEIVRVNQPGPGNDAIHGYYVGFSTRTLYPGRMHNNWQPLATFDLSKLECRVVPNVWNLLRVAVEGKRICVWFNRMHPSADKDAGLRIDFTNDNEPVLSGNIGLRTAGVEACFDNVLVLPASDRD